MPKSPSLNELTVDPAEEFDDDVENDRAARNLTLLIGDTRSELGAPENIERDAWTETVREELTDD
ncbi:MAG: hypothetical protein PHX87_04200 [Candidatus Peribacteraceae bacterium]|nr:hypothetical protein [Candidatus Peribacteraceae bacterium]MDD5742603.1 hypothetical protein [Candidatus Peribacteraceae bacterium]